MTDEVWWDDVVRWVTWGSGVGLVLGLVAWVLVAYGEHRMANLYLDARGDADWCVSIIEPALRGAERAASEAHRVSLTLAHYLDTPAPLPEVVAEVVQ